MVFRSVYGAPDKMVHRLPVMGDHRPAYRRHTVSGPGSPSIAAVPSRSVYPTARRFRVFGRHNPAGR